MLQRLRANRTHVMTRVLPDASRWHSWKQRSRSKFRRLVSFTTSLAIAVGTLIGVASPAHAVDYVRHYSNADSTAGSNYLIPYTTFTYKNQMLFLARVPTYSALFVGKADGSTTTLVSKIASTDSNMAHALFNGNMYMVFNDANTAFGTELYKYDGTTLSRVGDWATGTGNFFAYGYQSITVMNNEMWFFGSNGTNSGLYHWDGVAASPTFVPGTAGLTGKYLTAFAGHLYFQANRGLGLELYKFDGSSVSLAANIASDAAAVTDSFAGTVNGQTNEGGTCDAAGRASNFPIANNYLFFYARPVGASNYNLYSVSPDGTVTLVVASGTFASPSCPVEYDNAAYFVANINSATIGFELYKWTGVGSSPTLALEIVSGSGGIGGTQLSVWQNKLYLYDSESPQTKVRTWVAGAGSTAAATSTIVTATGSSSDDSIMPVSGTSAYGVSGLAWGGGFFASSKPTSPTTWQQALFLNFETAAPVLNTISDQSVANGAISIAAPTVASGVVNAWQATGLPSGLMINQETGVISGTSTATGTFAVTVTAYNNYYQLSQPSTSVKTFNLTLTANPPVLSASQSAKFVKGSAATFPVANFNTGGLATTYSATSLPAGMAIDSTTGVISGTATTLGSSDYTVTATNAQGSSSMTLTATVIPKPLLYSSTASVQTATTCTINAACTIMATPPALTETSGLPLTYSSTSLPAGVSLDANTGALSGTVTSLMYLTPIVVSVTDGYSVATFSKTINVYDIAPVITSYGPLNLPQSSAVSGLTLPATTGGTPLQYTTVAPAITGWTYTNLPAGLSSSSTTGLITGTPTTPGTYSNVTVKAYSYGNVVSNTLTFTINVTAVAPVFSYSALTCVAKSACLSTSPTVTAGTVTSYSINPALPSGMTFNTTTGAIGGTPADNTQQLATNYTVTGTNSVGSYDATVSITVKDYAPTCTAVTTVNVTAFELMTPTTPITCTAGHVTSYSIEPGYTLPTGLSINASTGEITGTPTTTSANVKFRATVLGGNFTTTSAITAITVQNVAPVLNPISDVTSAAFAYMNTVTPTGKWLSGVNSFSCAITNKPSYLSINASTCVITGPGQGPAAPTATKVTVPITVTATNTFGSSTQTFNTYWLPSKPIWSNSGWTVSAAQDAYISQAPPGTSGGGVVGWFSVTPALPAGLTLNTTTGYITGTPTVGQAATNYTMTVGNDGGSSSTTITIGVLYKTPTFASSTFAASQSLTFDQPVSITAPTYSSGTSSTGSPPTSWAITPALPTGLTFNTTTGAITGTPTGTTNVGPTNYTVTATNSVGTYTFSAMPLSVSLVKPTFSAVSAQSIGRGVPYSLTFTNTGSRVSLCSKTVGTLPAGISLNLVNGQCVLSGTPTTITAASSVSFTGTNQSGTSTALTFNISVIDVPPVLASVPTQSLIQGVAYSLAAPVNTGGTITSWSISAGALPDGVTLNTSTGVISGTPTTAGSWSATLQATNSGGSATTQLSGTVAAVIAPGLTNPGAHFATLGQAMSFTIANSGSAATFAVTSGTLPTGFTLNVSTGEISGSSNTEQASRDITVTATNYTGSQTVTFAMAVVQPLAILANVSPITLTQGVAYTGSSAIAAPTNTGGVISSWSASNLPAGMTINAATGVISGAPTGYQDATDSTVTATTTGGDTSTLISFAVTRVYAPVISNPGEQNITMNNALDVTFTNSGSAATWSATGLPSTLSINTTTGEITGTPTTEHIGQSVTLTATNYSGSDSATFTLNIRQPAPVLGTLTAKSFVQGDPAQMNAPDNTGGGNITWTATGLPAGLTINSATGEVTGTPSTVQAATDATITATNSGGAASVIVSIEVTVTNPPDLTTPSAQVYTVGVPVSLQIANAGSHATWSVTAGTLPAGLTLDTTTGEITGTPTAETATGSVTIEAVNYTGNASVTFDITVNLPVPVLATVADQSLTQGVSFSLNAPSNTGGAVATWTASGLPAGLSIDASTGEISGTPTTAGSNSVTITATNSGGSVSVSANFEVAAIIPPSLTSISAQVLTLGQTYSFTFSNSGDAATWSATGLPDGMSVNANTGEISGTPTTEQSPAPVTLTATNYTGTDAITFDMSVVQVVPILANISAQTLTLGQSVTINAATNSGGPIASWSSSDLPAGLSIDVSTGDISGAPSALQTATDSHVTATNSGGSDTITISFTINAVAPSLTAPSAVTLTKGIATSTIPAPANSGGDIVTWSSTDLPNGLIIDATTGDITGTPTDLQVAADSHITATNSGGSDITTLNITVNDVTPDLGTYSAQVLTLGQAITSIAATSNAGGPVVTWSATGLPSGLAIDPTTGEITGTPDTLQSASDATITASNTGGSDTASISFTVNDVIPDLGTYSAQVLTLGQAITSITATSNSGGPVVTWTATGLPAGLAIDSTSGEITGTPTALQAVADATISATNTGGSDSATILFTVNDVIPDLGTYSAQVLTLGHTITSIAATSNAGGPIVTWTATGLPSGLAIDSTTGEISGTPDTLQSAANATITATNSGGSDSATINFTVNDVAPSLTSLSPITLTKGTQYVLARRISLPVNSGGPAVSWTVIGLPSGMTFDGTYITGTPDALQTASDVTITATNTGGSHTVALSFTVVDVVPSLAAHAAVRLTLGQAVTGSSAISAPTNSGGPVVTWTASGLPHGLSINSATGAVAGTPDQLQTPVNVTFTATNTGGSDSRIVSFEVVDVVPSLGALAGMRSLINTAITPIAAPSNTGGPVVTWSAIGLPHGVTINSTTGVISGTPDVLLATTNIVVTATNSGGSASTTFSMEIYDVLPQLDVMADQVFTVGDTVNIAAPRNFGGPVVMWTIIDEANSTATHPLPDGLSFDTSTGVISGSANGITGRGSYLITATNSGGAHSSRVFITINDHAPIVVDLGTYSLTRFSAMTQVNAADSQFSNGGAVTEWTSSDLPAGLTINRSTGVISGTPLTPQVSTLSHIHALNTGGAVDTTVTFEVIDVAPVLLSSTGTINIDQWAPFSYDMIANNTLTSLSGTVASWTAAGLPAGMTIDATTGVISGAPTVNGSFTATITATNSIGSSNLTMPFSITAISAPSLPTISNQAYTMGQAYSLTITNAGDFANRGWSVTGLPSFCSSQAAPNSADAVVIDCAPTAEVAATTVTVIARNYAGASTIHFTIAGVQPLPNIHHTSGTAMRKGEWTVEYPMVNTGGPITSWSASNLPPGMTIDTATGFISGYPTQLGDYVTTYYATNSGGTVSVEQGYVVLDQDPVLAAISDRTYTKGQAITPIDPRIGISGGPPTGWGVHNLPSGLHYDSTTGVISGTPDSLTSSLGNHVTVFATNSGCGGTICGTTSFNITVIDVPPSLLPMESITLDRHVAMISLQPPTNVGGDVVSWNSDDLPGGLTIDSVTGVISGTPEGFQSLTVSHIRATNSGGSDTTTINIAINDLPPIVNAYGMSSYTITKGRAISAIPHPLVVLSGGSVVTWSSSDLPAGLSIHPSTGAITGTPTSLQAATNSTVTASNTGGHVDLTINFTVIDVAPIVAAIDSRQFTVGVAITPITPVNSGGPAVNWSATSLPEGLSIDTSTGVISGTPTTPTSGTLPKTSSATITATNTGGHFDRMVSLTVNTAPILASVNDVLINSAVVYTLAISNSGGAVTTWSISSGTLPTGLTLNNGIISGAPMADGSYQATVRAANYSGASETIINFLVDTTVPVLQSITVNPSGTAIVGTYSEPLGTVAAASGFTFFVRAASGTSVGDANDGVASLDVSGSQITWNLVRVITAGQTVLVSYGSSAVQDTHGLNTVGVSNRMVNNPLALVTYQPAALPCPQSNSGATTLTTSCVQLNSTMPTIHGSTLGFTGMPLFRISPSLPSGLSLNQFTGEITGTPTVRAPSADYMITVSNGTQTASTTINLKVIFTPARPTSGSTGVSINNAATWTTTTSVNLNLVWPQGASYIQVSNDGGMNVSTNFDIASSIPWTLDSSQSASAQRSVYVRFLNTDGEDLAQNSSAFTDDIELDNVVPAISTVTAAANAAGLVTVTYAVSDNIGGSGIQDVQVADTQNVTVIPNTPLAGVGTAVANGKATIQDALGASVYLRVRDFAGNYSAWMSQTITLPPPPPASQGGDNAAGGELADNSSLTGSTGTAKFSDGSTVNIDANGVVTPYLISGYIGTVTGKLTVSYVEPTTQIRSSWSCTFAKFGTTKKNPKAKVLPKTKWFPLLKMKPAKGCKIPPAVFAITRTSQIKVTSSFTFVRLWPTTGLAKNPVTKKKILPLKRTMRLLVGVRPAA